MHHGAAKFVPRILTGDQKQHRTLPSSPSSFWRKTKWLSFPTHRTPLIWCPVTSSYFQKWKWSWKDAAWYTTEEIQAESQRVLDTDRTGLPGSVQKWKRLWDRCLHAGGTYFEGYGGDRPYDEFYDFYSISPETFGYHLVCMYVSMGLCVFVFVHSESH
jgi:hypothetical protein